LTVFWGEFKVVTSGAEEMMGTLAGREKMVKHMVWIVCNR